MYHVTLDNAPPLIFRDEPVFCPLDDYMRVRNQYVEAVARLPGVMSIYQFGGISAPGISDLDLFVVVDGESPPPPDELLPHGMGKSGQYIFVHPAMVSTEAIFVELQTLLFASNLTHLVGRQIALDRTADTRNRARANVIDYCVFSMHRLTKCVVLASSMSAVY